MASSENPFAPPLAALNDGTAHPEIALEFASRWRRLASAVIDMIAQYIASILLGGFIFRIICRAIPGASSLGMLKVNLILFATIFWLIHGLILFTRGQTIGKMFLRIRIVSIKTRKIVNFPRIIMRYLLPQFSLISPVLCAVVFIFDTLFIISHERQCLHDLLAGTVVVKLTD